MLPNFLCIGAQKAGTTWLHTTLSRHPETWLPPVKEVDFWFHSRQRPSPFSYAFYDGRWRRHFARALGGPLWREPGWYANYFFRERTLDWYARLFEPGRGRCTGDVTPSYAKLTPEEIALVKLTMPQAKIIYLMRDPIDRAWSGARMWADQHGCDVGRRDWTGYCERAKARHGDYVGVLRNWRAHFPPAQILVGFTEDIANAPEQLWLRVCSFLGVTATPELLPSNLRVRANASSHAALPRAIEFELAKLYIDDLRELEREFGASVEPWRRRAERVLAGGAAESR